MYFAFIYENKRMKHVEIILRIGGQEEEGEHGGGKSN
jgi:hypothetical protein